MVVVLLLWFWLWLRSRVCLSERAGLVFASLRQTDNRIVAVVVVVAVAVAVVVVVYDKQKIRARRTNKRSKPAARRLEQSSNKLSD